MTALRFVRREGRGPSQPDLVAGRAEDAGDVGGDVREGVSRGRPFRPAAVVDEAAPVGLDHSSQQRFGPSLGQLLLPLGQPDPPRVLLPGPCWGKRQGQALRVARDLKQLLTVSSAGATSFAGITALIAGFALVTIAGYFGREDPEPVDTPAVRGDRAVAEIEAEQIDVLPAAARRTDAVLVAARAGRRIGCPTRDLVRECRGSLPACQSRTVADESPSRRATRGLPDPPRRGAAAPRRRWPGCASGRPR